MLKLTSVSVLLALGTWGLIPTQQPGPTCEVGWGSPAELPHKLSVLLAPLASHLLLFSRAAQRAAPHALQG